MSVNKWEKHIYVLPEDDANRQLANGFLNNLSVDRGQAQVLPPAGGWVAVLDKLEAQYIPHLRQFREGAIVLLIDFDERYDVRRARFDDKTPPELKSRVFVIGALDEPEDFKRALKNSKSLEDIGSALADDCHNGTTSMWSHVHLKHNEPDRLRLVEVVKPILFGG